MWKFIDAFAEEFGLTKTDAEKYTKYFLNKIQEGVNLTGYFSSEIREVPEKSGTTKIQGEEKAWTVPAHKELKIKLSRGYKLLENRK